MPQTEAIQHYTLKQRAIAWISSTLFDWPVYTVRRGLLAGMRRKGGMAWLPVTQPDTAELRYWTKQDFTGKVVYDIGAFHGLLTLYFAKSASRVVSFEPDEINRRRLMQNISLNGLKNVTVRPVGMGEAPGQASVHHEDLMPGGSRIRMDQTGGVTVTISTLDQEIASGLPAPDFVKVDVEGFEIPVLRGAQATLTQYRPDVFVEIHGFSEAEKVANAEGVISLLHQAGYNDVMHLESGVVATPENARRGHVLAFRPRS